MKNRAAEDFIKYAKEQFGCDIFLKSCDKPDTFESIFGASFISQDDGIEKIVDGFEDVLRYENITIDVHFEIENVMEGLYYSNIVLAA